MAHSLYQALVVNRFPGHDGLLKKKVLNECRDDTDLSRIAARYLAMRSARARIKKIDLNRIFKDVEREMRMLHSYNISCAVLGDDEYPFQLAMISDPPIVLYYRGQRPVAPCVPAGVVGTRRPTAEGLREAYKLSAEIALAGYVVVSGLAFGIDRAAHIGALAVGGQTWAVLAGGLDRPSPFSNRALAGQILDKGGALLGEIPPGDFPQKYAFPRRNRILSGLCRGCVVVQAPQRSGALITAEFALDQGRDVYVGYSGLSGKASAGTAALAEHGAPVVRNAADILNDWGNSRPIDRLVPLAAPQSPSQLSALMKNELNGQIYRYMGGWFEQRYA